VNKSSNNNFSVNNQKKLKTHKSFNNTTFTVQIVGSSDQGCTGNINLASNAYIY
jgi:hypothetical protein